MSRIILIAVLILVIWAVFFLPPPLDTEKVETPQAEPTRTVEPQLPPTLLPTTETYLGKAPATPWIAIAIGKVNFRSSCSTGANILAVVLPGQKVRVLEHASHGWVPVEFNNMYGCLMSACVGLEDGICQ